MEAALQPSMGAKVNLRSFTRLLAPLLLLITGAACGGTAEVPPVAVSVRIDPTLNAADAWAVGPVPNPWPIGQPLVQATPEGGDRFRLEVTTRVTSEEYERVEFTVAFNAQPPQATASALWYEESERESGVILGQARELRGTLSIDAAGSPSKDASRVIAYDLQGERDGKKVSFRGKLVFLSSGR